MTATKECVNSFAAENTFKGKISKAGTLLMSFKLTVGKVSILGIDAFHNEAIISIYPFVDPDKITTMFLFATLPLLSQSGDTKSAIKGNTLNSDSLDALLIPLPPIMEQKRIFDKLHELTTPLLDYGAAEQKVTELNVNFPERLKKSILQEAVQGKLVPQDPSDEPAEALLERIRAEKQRLIKEGKIKKDKHESVIFRRDNSHYEKRGSEEVCIDEEIPFEIPENWAWARLSSASISIADGDHQPPPQVQDGIPFLVISNVSDGIVDFSNTRYVPKKYFDSLAEIRIPQCGDLLFTVTGSYGIVIPVQTERKFCFQRHIALIKLGCLSSEFMRLWLSSPLVYEQCRRAATGTAQKTVGLASLKGLLIPIPPLNEQVRILQKLNTLLALAAL